MTIDHGGPAFPTNCTQDEYGMTTRMWLAGQALAGYLAMHADHECDSPAPDEAARECLEFADAMIRESRKPVEPKTTAVSERERIQLGNLHVGRQFSTVTDGNVVWIVTDAYTPSDSHTVAACLKNGRTVVLDNSDFVFAEAVTDATS